MPCRASSGACHGPAAGFSRDGDAERAHHLVGLVAAPVGEQEAGRLGDVAVERDQREPGRDAEEPHDPPAVGRDQPVRGPARDQEAERGADAGDEHDDLASAAGGDRLGEQRVDDRQQAAGAHAHEQAGDEVLPERGHRAAHRGADEERCGEQDRGAAADPVAEVAPDQRAEHRADDRDEREQRHRPVARRGVARRVQVVLVGDAGEDEGEGERLLGVDRDAEHQHEQQLDVRRAEAARVERGELEVARRRRRVAARTAAPGRRERTRSRAAIRTIPMSIQGRTACRRACSHRAGRRCTSAGGARRRR